MKRYGHSILIILGIIFCCTGCAEEEKAVEKPDIDISTAVIREESEEKANSEVENMAKDILTEVNALRREEGQAELVWREDLEKTAFLRAEELAEDFSHERPCGEEWYTVNSEIVYGENIAMGGNSATEVMEAWGQSAPHRDNMVYHEFTAVGVGIYQDREGNFYWVMHLSR